MRSVLSIILLLTAFPCLALAEEGAKARLTIGEEQYRVPIGKPFALMLDGERVTMKIELEQTKAFDQHGVRFQYPVGFRLRADEANEDVTVWTLEGASAAVVLQKYRDKLDAESLAEAIAATIVERNGEDRVKKSAVSLRSAGREFPGARLVISAAPGDATPLVTEQNLFVFENTEGVFALIVQDSREPKADASGELKEVVRLLGESFDGGEPPAPEEPPADEAGESDGLK